MNFDFLGEKIVQALNNVDVNVLYEIRLRENFPVKIKLGTKFYVLKEYGVNNGNAILCDKKLLANIIDRITNKSLYAFNDKIKRGYLTFNGVRLGLAGECVIDKGQVLTLKNITSLNVRIPHEISGCSRKIFKYVYSEKVVRNTLIISPPFCGKTTILKDIALKLNSLNKFNVMIIDERGEFENVNGENIDKITYSNKLYGFQYGIRSLSPNVVIVDELVSDDDWLCVKSASESGVKIIATCHAENIDNVKNKNYFIKGVFDKYVILKNGVIPGLLDIVYDKNFNLI